MRSSYKTSHFQSTVCNTLTDYYCRIVPTYIKVSLTMRLTCRKKEILSHFDPANRDWVTNKIGPPPFDVSCITWLLYISGNRHNLESTRRTLEARVKDGLLEKSTSYEQRHNRKYASSKDGVRCKVSRYGLPGQCVVTRDYLGVDGAFGGE